MKMDAPTFVKNAERLTSVLETWTAFHDSEVVDLSLSRGDIRAKGVEGPSLMMKIQTAWEPKVVVTFRFEKVEDLKLEHWNHQNVLYELHLRGPSDAEAPARISVSMETSFGLHGSFSCSSMEVVKVERVA